MSVLYDSDCLQLCTLEPESGVHGDIAGLSAAKGRDQEVNRDPKEFSPAMSLLPSSKGRRRDDLSKSDSRG